MIDFLRHLPLLALLPATAVAQGTVDFYLNAAPGVVDLGPGYTNEPAWTYGNNGAGTIPGPVIRATRGQALRVHFRNDLPESTTVHFHGQPSTVGMDGMDGISRPAVAPGQEFRYELRDLHSGTYWFHPHSATHHEQLDHGLHGVLIVDPPSAALDPAFDLEQVVVLDDWDSAITGGTYTGSLLNGKTSLGQTPIVVQPGQRLRLRLINVAASTNYVVALDGHPFTVTHADGNRVQPVIVQAVPIGIGERYDVIVDCVNPGVWSLAVATLQSRNSTVVRGVVRYAGQTGPDPAPSLVPGNLSSGTLLGYAQLASYWPAATPITAAPDRQYPIVLGNQMAGPGQMAWTINGQIYPNITPLQVAFGDVVQLDITSTTPGMMMLHPMHMHGHFVQLMGTAGSTTHPPIKDTVLIQRAGQPGSSWSVQFRADNPGSWLYHCHDLMHMMGGMMTRVDYVGDHDGDGIADAQDMEATRDVPVLTVSSDAAAFAPGGTGALELQWQPGQWLSVHVALQELPLPILLPPYGEWQLSSLGLSQLGAAIASPIGKGSLGYTIPNDPALTGFRFVLQALAGSTLPGGLRVSTHQAFTIR
ncbi:MAG: multicopper oxidase family protein [Planctomycetes bacterium]|nr:multicopper oxidase family protein [Planctomycetota bacterium]